MSLDGKIGSSPNAHLISSSSPASTVSPPMNNVSLGPAPLHATAAAPAESSSSSSSLPNTLETLDEPVLTTILRDLKRIGVKTKHVLIPKSSAKELRDCRYYKPVHKSSGQFSIAPRLTILICIYVFLSFVGDLWGPLILCLLLAR